MDWLAIFEALKSVYDDGAYSNIAINDALKNHPDCNSGFVRTVVKGVIRNTIKLDYIISKLAKNGLKGIKIRTLIILRIGIYVLSEMDSVPDHAAVDQSVGLSKIVAKGTDKFINAILRSYLRDKDIIEIPDSPLIKYSFQADLYNLLERQYGDETIKIVEELNKPRALTIRANTLKNSAEDVSDYLNVSGIKTKLMARIPNGIICGSGNVLGTSGYRDGMFSVQSPSSMIAINQFKPEPGSLVLDMCAAPGGKTAAMAESMHNQGKIIACDVHEHRLELIDATMKRLGIDIVKTATLDGTLFNSELENKFDYVLADVPCSGLGVIPTKPEIKYRTRTSEYNSLITIQKRILMNAIRYTKPGGLIEYSTCTINKNENDGVVLDVLKDFNDVQILEKSNILPYNNLTGFYYCIMQKQK